MGLAGTDLSPVCGMTTVQSVSKSLSCYLDPGYSVAKILRASLIRASFKYLFIQPLVKLGGASQGQLAFLPISAQLSEFINANI